MRQQLELMGGSVELESEPGRGSRFECCLALAPVGATPVATPHRELVAGCYSPIGVDDGSQRGLADCRTASAVS